MDSEGILPDLKLALEIENKKFKEVYLWLKEAMPKNFFEEVNEERIWLIVHSLMGFKMQKFFSQIHLRNSVMNLCLESPEADVTILRHYPMHGINNYTTYTSLLPLPESSYFLRVAMIYFTEAVEKEKGDASEVNPHFLKKMTPERQRVALEMFQRAQERDHCQYEVHYEEKWKEKGTPSMHLILAWKNVAKHNFLYRLAKLIYQHGLVMRGLNATYSHPYEVNSILLLSVSLHGSRGESAQEATDIADFLQEVVTLKYFGGEDLIEKTFVTPKLLRGNLANLLRSMMPFIHQILVHVDQNLYHFENIQEGLCRHPELTVALLQLFEHKFHPTAHNLPKYEEEKGKIELLIERLDTGNQYHDLRRKNILLQGLNFIEHTLKNNFYRNNKTGLIFRLDPLYLDHVPFERKKIFPLLPCAIFYMKGMHYFGFHIRFKDLARGGLRTIFPKEHEKMVAERENVFLECYNLAYTQNKKNKDIPEGGAKGVIFLKPYEQLEFEAEILAKEMQQAHFSKEEIQKKIALFTEEQKLEYLYQTQRSYIKNLLTLVNCFPDGKLKSKDIVDYWQKPEYLYLGPDENMHNAMIEWIAKESRKEEYKPGIALISGKPKLGFNHKEYGVTSYGVHVYVEELLKHLGIDPFHEPFTVKISGGPDGDVAGNEIYNLYKSYPETAKLLAVTDISGTIYDPAGLDLAAMTQLFQREKPLRFYPYEKLSPGGFLLDLQSTKEESSYVKQTLCWKNQEGKVYADWISGNEMNALFRHNVHQTKADIFIPCGGRPNSITINNLKDFLTETGLPTSRAIVEGANLYLSEKARLALEEKGVLIVKDSSANKGGVICSSFEILCSLTLEDEEFLRHKEELIQEILQIICFFALAEARLLLSSGGSLTKLSEEISEKINFFTDQLLSYLEPKRLSSDPQDPFLRCFLSYCPKLLRENYLERLIARIPDVHKKAIIASHLAANLVYQRGLCWSPSLIDILPSLLEDPHLLQRKLKT